ncbi:carboxypeptidase regulatory-like domain-containing protein [Paenibacillus sp. 1P07SE]|uniref:carboxypeptidase regulatory-like domain-containing protein n=1 Tax=Paenibacillus sp. 1P07SE TaxID=3132209 RepID=UPI0039A5D38A
MRRMLTLGLSVALLAGSWSGALMPTKMKADTMIAQGVTEHRVYADADLVLEKAGAAQDRLNYQDPAAETMTINGNQTGNPSWREGYMQFTVPPLEGKVEQVRLHLYASYPFAAPTGQTMLSLTPIGRWSESDLTVLQRDVDGAKELLEQWENPTENAVKAPGGTWIEIDLTGKLAPSGTFTLKLSTDATRNLSYSSSNSELQPYLEIGIDPEEPAPAYPIAGSVLMADGSPLEGVELALYSYDDELLTAPLGQTVSDAAGAFAFADEYAEGRYRVSASLEGYASSLQTLTVLGGAPGGFSVTLSESIASEDGYTIAGEIKDTAGAALSGASVKLYTLGDVGFINPLAAATSNASGAFILEPGFASGSYYLEVTKSGYASHTSIVMVDHEPLEHVQVVLHSGDTAFAATATPGNHQTGVPLDVGSWLFEFNTMMDPASMNPATITLTVNGQPVAYTAYEADNLTYTILFDEPLEEGATYTASISSGVRTADEASLTQPIEFAFTSAKPILPVQIDIDSDQESEMAPQFSGFNVNNFATAMMYNDEEVMEATKYLTPGWLRFSSGTASDAYNWKTGDYPDAWLDQFVGYGMYNTLRNYKPWIHGKGGVWIQDFEELVAYSGSDIIMVINGFTDSVASTVELAQYVKDRNLPVTYWELTNEPYMFTNDSSPAGATPFFADASDFAEHMKPYCEAVKSVLPDALCSMPFSQGEEPEWDEEMGNYPDKYWDAMTFHYYTGASTDMIIEESVRKLNDALAHTTNEVIDSYYKPKMPADRQDMPIIITEFNNNVRVEKSPLLRTLYNGIYVAEYVARMSNVPNVKHVGLHVLQKDGFNSVNDRTQELKAKYNAGECTQASPCDTTTWDFGLYPTATGLGLKLVNDAVNRSEALLHTTLSGGAGVPTLQENELIPALHAQAYKGAAGKRYLVLTNKSDQGHLAVINRDGAALTSSLVMHSISGTDMTLRNDETDPNRLEIVTESTDNPVLIPPYSVIRLEWTETPTSPPQPHYPVVIGSPAPPVETPGPETESPGGWSVERIEDQDGRMMEKRTLAQDASELLLQRLEEEEALTVTFGEGAAVRHTILSALAWQQILEHWPEARLKIESPEAGYELPLHAVDLQAIEQLLGADGSDIFLQISVTDANPSLTAQAYASASRSGIRVVAPIIEFSVTAQTEDRVIEWELPADLYVSRSLTLPDQPDPARAVGVRYDAAEEAWEAVPTQFGLDRETGRYWVELRRMGNSIYTVVESSRSFEDTHAHWARGDIELLAAKLIVSGLDHRRFAPDAPVTRAEFTAMLVRGLALPKQPTDHPFTDVPAEAWYAQAVGSAYHYDLLKGTAPDSFSPGSRLTVAQGLLLAERVWQLADAEAGREPAAQERLTSGIKEWSGERTAPMSRAQAVVLLKNILQSAKLLSS